MLSNLLLVALPVVATYLIVTVWQSRYKQFAHFPQPKTSLLWGHLKPLGELMQRSAPGLHIDHILAQLAQQAGNPPVMFLDLRPASYPMVVVCNQDVAEQVSRASKLFPWSTPKSPTLSALVRLTGDHSILVKQNEDWKQTRKRFNPGFAPQHLMSLLPCILDKTDIFVQHLDNLANSGKEFPLIKFAINLTFDIIGAVVMGVDFDAQHADSSSQGEFIRLYDELLSTYNRSGLERLPQWMFVRREWRRYRLSSKIDRLLEGMIRQKHAEGANSSKTNASSRSVLNLSLQGNDSQTGTLSDDLVHETRDQIKTFLFAGHDTTSILLAWLFYELARTPRALKAVRDELDDIFGPDPDPAVVRQKLLAPGGEDLIHRMTYTSAVIKEILRLYPPAGTARMAPKGSNFTVQLPDGGGSFCVDGFVIYNCATLIQRDRTVFGESARDFVPERWLGDKSGIMSAGAGADSGRKYPAGAWRPFERGPRNCIGQDLATIEARVIIAAVARRYDFFKVGLGELDLDEKGQPVLNEKGQFKVKAEMYNTQQVTAKPVDGMRMKVRRR